MKYKPEIAKRNYAIALALVLVSIAALVFMGTSIELIMLKILMVPLAFLAWKGVFSLYAQPIYEHKITLRAFECSCLQALVYSLAFCVFLWQPDNTLRELAQTYGLIFIWFFVLQMILMALQVYGIARDYDKIAKHLKD